MRSGKYIFVGTALLLAMGVNLPHLVRAYETIGEDTLPGWYTYLMLSIFDIGIFILAMYGERSRCIAMAWGVFLISLYSYLFPGGEFMGWTPAISQAVLFSAAPAFLVFFFSDTIAKEIENRQEEERRFASLEELQKLRVANEGLQVENANANATIADLQLAVANANEVANELQLQVDAMQMQNEQLQKMQQLESATEVVNVNLQAPVIATRSSYTGWTIDGKSGAARNAKYHRWKKKGKGNMGEDELREFERLEAWMEEQKNGNRG